MHPKVGMHNADSVKPLEAQANEKLKDIYSRHRLYLLGIANSVMPQKKVFNGFEFQMVTLGRDSNKKM